MDDTGEAITTQRLDKWLWHARIGRTRSAAAVLVEKGKVRVNRVRVTKPAHAVKPGDALTLALGEHVRVLMVLGFAERRGPAVEAQALYTDITPPSEALPLGNAPPRDGFDRAKKRHRARSEGRDGDRKTHR